MYYLNLHKTVSEKYKPTKQVSSYDYNENNLNYFIQQGYIMIGYDAIRHTYIGYQEAVNTGCRIGATVMLYKDDYIGSSSLTLIPHQVVFL
jgi:NDP-sugar pyrophosphorylase family protein